MRIRLQGNLIPEANRLLGLNLAEANRVELREDLYQVKDQLQDRMLGIQEAFREWMNLINEYGDQERRQQKEEVFHRFRLEGTVACPGDVDDLLEEVGDLILDVVRRIDRIMNPVVIPPLPVLPSNPIPSVGVPPIPAVVADQIPDITSKTHGKETRGDPAETESDGEPMENDIGEKTMSHKDIQEKNCTFISPGRVLSEKKNLKENLHPGENMESSTISNSENSSPVNGISEERFRKENLNPGEDKSVVDYNGQSSVKVADRVQWVRIAVPQNSRKKRQVLQKKSWTNFNRHRKYGNRFPRRRKSWSPTFRQRNSVVELPGPHRTNRKSDERNKKENLDPGIRTLNGHASLFRPGMSWIVPNHEKEDVKR